MTVNSAGFKLYDVCWYRLGQISTTILFVKGLKEGLEGNTIGGTVEGRQHYWKATLLGERLKGGNTIGRQHYRGDG